jgi:soluble lytic murein transglycosylase-like protein
MKITYDWQPLLSGIAWKYRIPSELVSAIIQVESGHNPFAVRYEPKFAERYLNKSLLEIKVWSPCSEATERIARTCSWGLMQVMGQVARERGFDGPFLSALCDPEIGIEYGCKHLALKHKAYYNQGGWPAVISAYNAGIPNPSSPYVEKVRLIWNP